MLDGMHTKESISRIIFQIDNKMGELAAYRDGVQTPTPGIDVNYGRLSLVRSVLEAVSAGRPIRMSLEPDERRGQSRLLEVRPTRTTEELVIEHRAITNLSVGLHRTAHPKVEEITCD